MTKLTTHALDTYSGKPAKGMKVDVFFISDKREKIKNLKFFPWEIPQKIHGWDVFLLPSGQKNKKFQVSSSSLEFVFSFVRFFSVLFCLF